jgi:NarL family two-component system response regulator LiaR
LIVDDHAVVRQGVRAYLESQPEFAVVAEADSGAAAVRLAAEHVPDVALMDLVLGGAADQAAGDEAGLDGVAATRQVRRVSPRTQVVILTSYHDDEYIFPALRAGAISYVLKDIKMDELAQAIRRAARGEATLHPRVAARVIQELNGTRGAVPNPFIELTERELEVLRLIANGLSNSEIAARLVISENTVKGYVSNVFSKLQLADRTQAAVYAWRSGLVRRD